LWWITPFHYFHGAAILNGTANVPRNLAVLLGLGAVGVAAAYWQFGRRDL